MAEPLPQLEGGGWELHERESKAFTDWWTAQGGKFFWHPTAIGRAIWEGCYLLNADCDRLTYQGHDLIVAFEWGSTAIELWLMNEERIPYDSVGDIKTFLLENVLPLDSAAFRLHEFKYVYPKKKAD